jgi:hypothetical protein
MTCWLSPKASGNLCKAHGRNDTFYRKIKFSIPMHIIFSPVIIISEYHFNNIALLIRNCRSKALALCAMAKIILTQVRGCLREVNKSPTGSSSQKVCFFHRTAHSHCLCLVRVHSAYRTAEHSRDSTYVQWQYLIFACPALSRNRKIRTIPPR